MANRTGFLITSAEAADPITLRALSIARREYLRRPWSLKAALGVSHHSDVFVRKMFAGDKAFSVRFFVRLLVAISQESARATLQVIADGRGDLDVVYRSAQRTEDVKTEVVEAAGACGRAFDVVQRAIADRVIDANERPAIEAAIRSAQQQLDDIIRTLTNEPAGDGCGRFSSNENDRSPRASVADPIHSNAGRADASSRRADASAPISARGSS